MVYGWEPYSMPQGQPAHISIIIIIIIIMIIIMMITIIIIIITIIVSSPTLSIASSATLP